MLKKAFDKEEDGDVLISGGRSPRPRDAATLILVRRDGAQPRVLMGKRAGGSAFMPDKYVFPGGRVDPHDGKAIAWDELRPEVEAKLRIQSRRNPRAFALTAIRETFEETGLIVGRSAEMPAAGPAGWEEFHALDVAPDLSPLVFIGRAVTPPYRPRRFDARFFMAEAELALIDERPPVDGAELSDLQWVTLADAMKLDLPSVTRFMLGEIGERLEKPSAPLSPPFLRWTRTGHQTDRL
ncbi:NUDIX domain-containing protein [Hyphomonas sp.]|uniref:NUDIX hydrolase n=1 Tax=Hyphomonas sp. TaxID=87 RepID=UPI0025BACB8A|nr:NUDIX domain-containing protein [Hyphomonas sp.]MBI1400400.1 NUDIX domain-containing protein [Hyphomonas sp.]